MNNLKNYSKPVMQMEQFVPQEYVASCWFLQLYCTGGSTNGDHFLFNTQSPPTNNTPAVGQVTHPAHYSKILKAQTPDEYPPSGQYLLDVLSEVGEFPGALADATNTNGNPGGARYWMQNKSGAYQIGYAWTYEGEYHFHEGEMEWELQNNPNATS